MTAPDAPSWLREVPAVEVLRRVWVQTFCWLNDEANPGKPPALRWRTEAEGFPPSTLMIASPYDLDVHYAKKRTTTWIGYKVHLTETCEIGQPPLITHVETTTAPVADRAVLADVHAALKSKDLLPERHLVDAGYIDADQLVLSARDHGITLVGPPPADNQWQARTEGAFTLEQFSLDWENQIATCPAGKTSESWIADLNRDHAVMRIRFSLTHCKACPLKAQCTRSNRRLLTPRRREEHEGSSQRVLLTRTRSSWRSGKSVPASREPSPKPSASTVCAEAATSVRPRRIFSNSWPPPPSISAASRTGSPKSRSRPHVSPPSSAS